jgi:hypothetical protein
MTTVTVRTPRALGPAPFSYYHCLLPFVPSGPARPGLLPSLVQLT